MNVWIPGLIVVAVGLAAGLWFGLRGRSEAAGDGGTGPADADAAGAAGPRPSAPRRGGSGTELAPASSSRSAGLVGFLFGVGTCAIVGGLIYWATQGAKPRDEMAGGAPMAPMAQPTQMASGSGAPVDAATAHEASADLTPEVAAQLDQFRQQVQAAPQDLQARRQLTVALLNANLLMEAFEQARELQKVAPNDPDGMFVEGVVRLAMGQWPVAAQLMGNVLAQHPDHLLASLAKGQAEAALGQTPQAIATLRKGLAAAGGSFPPIEELLAQLEAGGGAGAGGMGGEAPPAAAAGGAALEVAAPPAGAESGGSYRVHIELAPGTVAPRGADGSPATLFLALRGAAPGPPSAVKRLVNPAFPLDLTLSASDSMMGQPLPLEGKLSVSLDGDGNASTKEPGDLVAAVEAHSGTPVHITLESGAK
jgi:hypothetical protein